ncbi:hypothetical protein CARUB_v100036991mg, partial [Capsella rubella]
MAVFGRGDVLPRRAPSAVARCSRGELQVPWRVFDGPRLEPCRGGASGMRYRRNEASSRRAAVSMSQFAGNHVGGVDPFDGVPDELQRDDYRQLERGFADDYGGTHAAWRGFSGSEETLGDLTEEDVRNLDGLLPSCSNGGTLVPGEPSTRRGKVFEDVVGSSSRNPHRSIVSGLRAS